MHLCSEIPALEPTQCPQSARCLKLPLLRNSLGSCSHFLPLPLLPFLPSEQGAVCRVPCAQGTVVHGIMLPVAGMAGSCRGCSCPTDSGG